MSKLKIGLILSLICLMTLSACGSNQEKALKVGLLSIDDSVPFYVAEQENLFKDVKVELVAFSSGQDQATAMQAGEIDAMMTDLVVQGLLMKGGCEVKTVCLAFGATPAEGRFLVVSAPGSNITQPQDLEGATVAISSNTMMDFLLEEFADYYGLDQSKITTVSMPNLMLRLETLLNGQDIQAAILPDPLASDAVFNGAKIVIDDSKLDTNFSQSVIVVSQEALDKREKEVGLMLDGFWQGMELLNQNPAQYRKLCLEVAKVPAELNDTYPSPSYTPRSLPAPEALERVVNWLVSRQLIGSAYSYEQMVDTRFIQ